MNKIEFTDEELADARRRLTDFTEGYDSDKTAHFLLGYLSSEIEHSATAGVPVAREVAALMAVYREGRAGFDLAERAS